eukprot:scaffold111982_cov66-Phaeocystis_antarctica.AAC.1
MPAVLPRMHYSHTEGLQSSRPRPSVRGGGACPLQWLPVLLAVVGMPSPPQLSLPGRALSEGSRSGTSLPSSPPPPPLVPPQTTPPPPTPPPTTPPPSPLPAIDTSIKEAVLRSDADSEELADDHAEEQRRSLVSPESEVYSLPPPMPPSQPLTIAASRRLGHASVTRPPPPSPLPPPSPPLPPSPPSPPSVPPSPPCTYTLMSDTLSWAGAEAA